MTFVIGMITIRYFVMLLFSQVNEQMGKDRAACDFQTQPEQAHTSLSCLITTLS